MNRYGGVSNRAGTEYVASTKNNGVARYIRFAFSQNQQYLLVFTDRALRFVQDAGQVVSVGAAAWANGTAYKVMDLVTQAGVQYYCILAHTSSAATNEPGSGTAWQTNWAPMETDGLTAIYEIPTPYLAADLMTLQTMQQDDVVTIVHPNYAPRELKRFGHTQWTLTPIAFGPSIAMPTNVSAAGGVTATFDTSYAVTAVSDAYGDEGLPGTFTLAVKQAKDDDPTHAINVSWDEVPGASYYRVYKALDGQTYGFIGNSGGVPSLQTENGWSPDTASASTSSIGTWVASGSQARVTVINSGVPPRPANQQFTIAGNISIGASVEDAVASGRLRAYYKRDTEPRQDAGIIATISLTGSGSSAQDFAANISVPDNGYATLIIDVVPEVLGESGSTTFTCGVTETGFDVSWRSITTGFNDTGLSPQYDSAPPSDPALFAAPNKYPAVVSAYQQRRFFAATTDAPQEIWGSRTAIPQSFTSSTPAQDDDALDFILSSQELNQVVHLRDHGRLVAYASSGEWIIEGDNSNILKPSAINARRFSAHGSAALPPLSIGTDAIYVQQRSCVVRSLSVDTVQGISSADLSVFSAHLFDGYTLVAWDFAQIPHGIAWVARSDGVLLGMTYLPEQQVWGWHRHDTDGVIENVCVLAEGNEDMPYLCVRRTINGQTVRYIERMATRTITALTDVRDLVYMDASATYDGRNFDPAKTMTLSGGSAWDETETVTLTANAATFSASNVGDAVLFYDTGGVELVRANITAYSTSSTVTARPSKSVPSGLRGVASTEFGFAQDTISGLGHLEGKSVAVLGDGYVVSSPNNPSTYPPLTVSGGSITLPRPYVVVHIGLPYEADLETLDIDTPSGPSLKAGKQLTNKVTFMVEKSRAFYVGARPQADGSLANMDVVKFRDDSDNYDLTALKTDTFEATIQGRYNKDGRVFIRQPDPVPTSLLAVTPQGV